MAVSVAAQPEFGEYLASYLERKHLTQGAFAKRIPIAPSAVSLWVRGVQRPSRKIHRRVAHALGVTMAELEAMLGEEPGEEVELPDIAPELRELLADWTLEEQRAFALPAIELAEKLLRRERGGAE